jgi:murein L,D-transpeptidase YcbB/YkuD
MRGLVAMAVCGLAMALACGEGPLGPDESMAAALAYGEGPSGPDESLPAAVATALQATVEGAAERMPPASRGQGERVQAWNALRAFYRRRDDRPAWSLAGDVQPVAERLLGVLDGLAAEGLDQRLYPRQELGSLLAAVRAAASGAAAPPDVVTPPGTAGSPGGAAPTFERRVTDLVDLDVGLTYTFLVAARHISLGRLQPSERARLGSHTPPPQVDLVAALERALGAGGDVAVVLSGLAPRADGYARLRQSLASYRDLAAKGGWPPIPPGPRLRLGDSGPRVAALASRLAASGDLPAGTLLTAAEHFDAALAEALSRFQARHGLDLSASVDAATLAALEVPIERRIRQIELNMERWRWMASDLGSRYILVNLPDFRLNVVDGREVVLTMRVIVGKAHLATPVFSEPLTQIVLNPSWHIPDSIVANEIVPQMLRDPGYLSRKGLAIKRRDDAAAAIDPATLGAAEVSQLGKAGSSLRLLQPPGRDNALGRYKFVVNDRFNVYLHDTPTGRLFARTERDFSHGCIRLEKPAELARVLLTGDPRWTPAAIADEVESGRTVTIPLARPLPVHIVYQTAWVDPDGTLELRDDMYKHDAGLEAALAAETPHRNDFAALRTSSGTRHSCPANLAPWPCEDGRTRRLDGQPLR